MKRILLIEDNQDLRQATKDYLEDSGYQVIAKSDGTNFRQVINQFHPELVLLDINLPYKSGDQLSREIKTHPDANGVAVVLVSSVDNLPELTKQAKADAFIQKPIDFNYLLSLVEHLIK